MTRIEQVARLGTTSALLMPTCFLAAFVLDITNQDRYWSVMVGSAGLAAGLLVTMLVFVGSRMDERSKGLPRIADGGIMAGSAAVITAIFTKSALSDLLNAEEPSLWIAVAAGTSLALAAAGIGSVIISRLEPDDQENNDARIPTSEADEPIIGYRCWRVADLGSVAVLRSIHHDEVYWAAGLPTTGNPSETKRSGVHAFKTKEELQRTYMAPAGTTVAAVGRVALWGEVIEHEKGYRAQFAYPVELYAKDRRVADMLERFYGCKTGLMSVDLRELAGGIEEGSGNA